VEGGFVAIALGYGLAVEERNVIIQSGTQVGSLQGVLTDDIFTPIPGVTVTLRNVASKTEQDRTTGLGGNFGASGLIPGEYEVRVTQGAVTQIAASKVRIISNAVTTVSIIMKSPGFLEVRSATIDLSQLPLRQFSLNVLTDGFRIRPNFLRIAFDNSGILTSRLPVNLLDSVFEPLNRAEDVSFRYTIFDSGTGRELENQPINNIAGLGIANGDRPFKKFARPMIFLPRSTIRITIEEHFGRGTLFFVFQGYKILGAPSVGGRS